MARHKKPAALILPLLPKKAQPYAKATVALIGALASLAALHFADEPKVAAALQALTALGVYVQPNGEVEDE
ncbi:hypothetical protein ACFU6R_03285 [Streptomyces sp. NPDC057499]|uniref:DUF7439 family protein n=1 Tax=Streptomyces sp. NPDC057499 TaxID=3346150 RepID=UPI0036861165